MNRFELLCFQVLVAPIVEKGAVQRDIYLPDGGFQWQDSQSEQVFDGGTFLEDYPVPLEEVAVFLRRSWVLTNLFSRPTVTVLNQILKKIFFWKCSDLNLHFSTKDHWHCLNVWLEMTCRKTFFLYLHFKVWNCYPFLFVICFLPFLS